MTEKTLRNKVLLLLLAFATWCLVDFFLIHSAKNQEIQALQVEKQALQEEASRLNNSLEQQHKVLQNADSLQARLSVLQAKDKQRGEKGIAQSISYLGEQYVVFTVNLAAAELAFHSKDENGKPLKTMEKLKQHLSNQGQKIRFATNGALYEPDFSTSGLYIENGKMLKPLNTKPKEKTFKNFYIQPNGVLYIDQQKRAEILSTKAYQKKSVKAEFALQSGPMLVVNGKINTELKPNSKSTYVRSGVGWIDEQTLVFIISKKPVRFYDFARVFQQKFNCKNALYLDGFISEMYLPELGLTKSIREFATFITVTEEQ